MRKLTLDIDDLQVESFAVEPHAPPPDGTVRGHAFVNDPGEVTTDDDMPWYDSWWIGCKPAATQGTCIGPTYCCAPTWQNTCPHTCKNTCAETCYSCTYICTI